MYPSGRKACPTPELLLRLATAEVEHALEQYALAEAHFSMTHRTVRAARVRVEEALALEEWAKSLQPMREAA